VGLAAVIGDERSRRAAGEQVAVDAEREREQALGDSLDEAGNGFGEVFAEPHLALEVGEYRLDDKPDACLLDFGRRPLAEAVALGGDELDVDELKRAVELAAPQSFCRRTGCCPLGRSPARTPLRAPARSWGRPGHSPPAPP
jgi:hypothetical protein